LGLALELELAQVMEMGLEMGLEKEMGHLLNTKRIQNHHSRKLIDLLQCCMALTKPLCSNCRILYIHCNLRQQVTDQKIAKQQ